MQSLCHAFYFTTLDGNSVVDASVWEVSTTLVLLNTCFCYDAWSNMCTVFYCVKTVHGFVSDL
jgi:hypothetical protein